MKCRYAFLLVLICVFISPAPAQINRSSQTGGNANIRGMVLLPNGSPVNEPVKVTLKVMRGDQATT